MEVLNDVMPMPGGYGYGTVLRSLPTPWIETWLERREEAQEGGGSPAPEVLSVLTQGRIHTLFPAAGQGVGMIDEILPAGEIGRRFVAEA